MFINIIVLCICFYSCNAVEHQLGGFEFIDATPAVNSKLGEAVDIYGRHIIAGAPFYSASVAEPKGTVLIWSESTEGAGDWFDNGITQLAFTTTGNDQHTKYGESVAISSNAAVVGAWGDDSNGIAQKGCVYVYHESSPGAEDFAMEIRHCAPSTAHFFGTSVAIDGSHIAVSARSGFFGALDGGSIYVYTESAANLNDWFGDETLIKRINLLPAATDSAPLALCEELDMNGLNIYCVDRKDNSQFENGGALWVLIESSIGAKDWESNYAYVTPGVADPLVVGMEYGYSLSVHDNTNVAVTSLSSGAADGGRAYVHTLTAGGAADSTTIVKGSDVEDGNSFGCGVGFNGLVLAVAALDKMVLYIFTATSLGAKDWQNHESRTSSPTDNPVTPTWVNHIAVRGDLFVLGVTGTWGLGEVYVMEKCDTVDRYTPCDCDGLASTGASCDIPCENGAVSNAIHVTNTLFGFPLYEQCDCTGTGASGTTCNKLCENGGTDGPAPFGQCNCDVPNAVGSTCKNSCNVGITSQDWSVCNCTSPVVSGAQGKFCNVDVDDCTSSPCANGGTCTDYGADLFPNHLNEFNCSCAGTGYYGHTCEISDCASSPCLNDGKCEQAYDLDGPIGIQCNCSDTGYEGEFCQTETDECASNPCLNDGVCIDLLDGYTCDCTGTGYEGLTCAVDVDDCLSSPCQNDGVCQDKGANKFKCTCDEFWEGDVCTEDVDDCILKGYYCENGAECADDPVNMGDVMCTCIVEAGGFTGKYCDVPIEDACVTYNPCLHGGKCILEEVTNEMSCDCADTGYEGLICEIQFYLSECVSSPCLNNGQCYDPSDYQDDWYCVCTRGYYGRMCETSACDSSPCQNGATCVNNLAGEYSCLCAENFSGAQCEIDDDSQVQIGSSSSSSADISDEDLTGDDDENTEKEDDNLILIIIIVVGVIVLIVGILFFKKQTKSKLESTYTMPT